ALGVLGVETVKLLHVARRAQCNNAQDLGLPALEETRPVYARHNAHFRRQRAYLGRRAPIRPDALRQDATAYLGSHHVFVAGLDLCRTDRLNALGALCILGQHDVAQVVQFGLAFVSICARGDDVGNLALDSRADALGKIGIALGGHVFRLGLAHLRTHLFLDANHVLDGLVAGAQRLDHRRLIDLIFPTLDHNDGVFRPGPAQIEAAIFHLRNGGVDGDLAVDQSDAHTADWPFPGDVGDGQRSACANDAQHINSVLLIVTERCNDDLDFVAQVFGEERADRAIRDARRQDGLLRRAALAPEERAGDAPRCVQAFLVIDRQREEVYALPDGVAHGGCSQHHRIAHAHRDRAARLFGQLAR